MSYLIDTDILIEISKGNIRAIEFLETLIDSKISIISGD